MYTDFLFIVSLAAIKIWKGLFWDCFLFLRGCSGLWWFCYCLARWYFLALGGYVGFRRQCASVTHPRPLWSAPQKLDKKPYKNSAIMKHTLEEKRNIVRQIKRGRPLSSLCKALHLDRHMVRNWLLRYEKYGDQGLRIRTPKYHFNTQEKERIIWEHTKKRIPLQELSLRYDVDRV